VVCSADSLHCSSDCDLVILQYQGKSMNFYTWGFMLELFWYLDNIITTVLQHSDTAHPRVQVLGFWLTYVA
jgi:hypothetical protein